MVLMRLVDYFQYRFHVERYWFYQGLKYRIGHYIQLTVDLVVAVVSQLSQFLCLVWTEKEVHELFQAVDIILFHRYNLDNF